MPESADRKCYYCNTPEISRNHLRPYGPNGALICFDCMKASPGREKEAERQFGAMLDPPTDAELNEYRPIDYTYDDELESEIADRDADREIR